MEELTFVGLDVHARSVKAAVLDVRTGEVSCCSPAATTTALVAWLEQLPAPVAVAYEAGPTGYGLARACEQSGIACLVAAPSKIVKAPGERVKTDRRDALRLVKLLRLGELVAVRVPSREQEAARDLLRAREDARADLMRARHRISKLLLRQGRLWERSAWTAAHEAWLARQRFDEPALQLTYEECLAAMVAVKARRDALDAAILAEAAKPPWAAVVARLSCLRGVSTLTAFGLAVEIGEWSRYDGRSIGAYLGLVPSESSSGSQRRQGSITKTGNGHARQGQRQRRPLGGLRAPRPCRPASRPARRRALGLSAGKPGRRCRSAQSKRRACRAPGLEPRAAAGFP
jgi:transposase